MPNSWKVKFKDANKRLDVFMAENVDSLTRAQAKKRIESGEFLVNKKSATVHHFLKEGDVVERVMDVGDRTAKKLPHASAPETRPTVPAPKLNIIAETPDWIVVEKPAGVLMHPDSDNASGTLIDAVIEHAPQVAKVGEDPGKPGIMSRLDKDVSGLVVIAKTQDAFDDLKRQFGEHSVHKEYLALVHGEVPKEEGDLKFRIGRSTTKARMAARAESSEGGQAAWTHYDTIQKFRGATLLKLQILTGRTHQIRAHLHAFGHPVIGDTLYKRRLPERKLEAPRLMLQSISLAFTDPVTKERREFSLEPDPAFKQLIKSLSTGGTK
jgi:23S rRNA pseudouridine1911/1915/1917 synthase